MRTTSTGLSRALVEVKERESDVKEAEKILDGDTRTREPKERISINEVRAMVGHMKGPTCAGRPTGVARRNGPLDRARDRPRLRAVRSAACETRQRYAVTAALHGALPGRHPGSKKAGPAIPSSCSTRSTRCDRIRGDSRRRCQVLDPEQNTPSTITISSEYYLRRSCHHHREHALDRPRPLRTA